MGLFYLLLWVSPATADENFIQKLDKATNEKAGRPHISAIKPKINEASAYQIQKQYVDLRTKSEPIAGYKAGLTSKIGQQKFSVQQALSGVLFSSGHQTNLQKISLSGAGKLMIETELGFILSQDIDKKPQSRQELIKQIESIVSVIELPDLAFKSPKAIKGVDLIASNLASHQFAIGEPLSLKQINNINLIETELEHDSKTLFKGKASDALGDQWLALEWLVGHLLESGYKLKAGDLLITGSLGKMVPAETGNYRASFGPLGNIDFQIVP